jgi:hypothetical protein
MMTDFHEAYHSLFDLVQMRRGPESCVRLSSLAWAVHEAPEEGLGIVGEAAEQLKRGRHMDDDLVKDVIKTALLCGECQRRTRFALESIVRYLHSGGDLVAQVVNDALGLGMSEVGCTLAQVVGAVSAQEERSGLSRALQGLRDSDDYRYVANAANHMKHRNALQSSVGAQVTEHDEVDVQQHLAGFEHNGKLYSEAEAAEIRSRVVGMRALVADVLDELANCLE